jgi:hypothetical protein
MAIVPLVTKNIEFDKTAVVYIDILGFKNFIVECEKK